VRKRAAMAEKILLVDDDKILRNEFKDCFSEYDVIEAGTGEEALKIINKPNEIDLVILDVRMPGIDGLKVLEKIKETAPELGIIIFTGYGSKEIVIDALRKKADNFIEKPLNVDKTREIIEKVLAKKRGEEDISSADITGKIERVKHFLARNWCKKVTLKDAASAVYLSPKYLSRIFRESTGTGFSDYKLSLKIKEAKNMLKDTGLNIDQISNKLGYENPESFIRQFKKITKLTPTEYRRKKK
jgi:two-component system, response regulator YesN